MCYYPIYMYKDKVNGKLYRPNGKNYADQLERSFPVACGKCLECLKSRSIEWSYRIMAESTLHNENCCITLTYDDEHLPQEGLKKPDIQKFIKRLRKHLEPRKIRYFLCGEYGSKHLRPHYHLIIFGWTPPDLKFFKNSDRKNKVYVSEELCKLWPLGFHSVQELSIYNAKYCAKYLQKFNDASKDDPFEGKPPAFISMSLKPGIGFGYRNIDMENDKFYFGGESIRVPRYFVKFWYDDKESPAYQEFLSHRIFNAITFARTQEELDAQAERGRRLLSK